MKRNYFFWSILTSLLFIAGSANAQRSAGGHSSEENYVPAAPGVNIITSLEAFRIVNAKAFRNFTRTVKNPTDFKAMADAKGIYTYCWEKDICYRICYTKRGAWHHTLRYYTEDKLPRDVRHLIRSTYYDFMIVNVVEVQFAGKIAYVVILEDKTSGKKIKVVDGEMEIMENWKKA